MYRFLRHNIGKKYGIYIFLVIAAFEVAATWLILDVRAIYLQLFVVIYINALRKQSFLESYKKL